ncbi:MAG TPA: hypothetical protein VGP93_01895, partial [Polyangiaceae bacterium]|nr:hypothetical protein [Polyangiaceae bacterium]
LEQQELNRLVVREVEARHPVVIGGSRCGGTAFGVQESCEQPLTITLTLVGVRGCGPYDASGALR